MLVAAALAGCGASGFGTDVKGFTQQTDDPAQQAVLRSIATYRTTSDDELACSLVTQHFIAIRFENKPGLCQAIARHQNKRELPEKASVASLMGDVATVDVDEPSALRSVYRMKREGGTWKIDDIVEAK